MRSQHLVSLPLLALLAVAGSAAPTRAQAPHDHRDHEPRSRADGVTGAFHLSFQDEATLIGVAIQGHAGLAPHVGLDVNAARRGAELDDAELTETAVSLGPRFVLNPRSRLQIYFPLAVGLTVARLDTRNGMEREYILTAEAGLGLRFQVAGPLFLGADIRSVVRRTPGEDQSRFAASTSFGASLLF